ncbi:MAG: PAS domain-containing protein [Planctomycetota bacterium]|nr:MAG: PAS domain-containing protein [Planctomycetota bacterium]
MPELAQFFNAAGCALVMTDEAHVIREINDHAGQLIGSPRSQIVGQHFRDFIYIHETELISGNPLAYRGTLTPHGKDHFPIKISSRPWISGDVRGAIHTLEDLRDQHAALRQARRLEQNLNEILANTPAVVYTKNAAGQYEYVNQRFLDLFHLTMETVIGKTDYDIFPLSDAQAFRENDVSVLNQGRPIQLEEVAPHDDGPHSYVSIKFPLKDEHGNVRAVAGISTDVTELRRAHLLEQDVQAAALVQAQLYPHAKIDFPGYEMAGVARPSQYASGDYYDFIPHGPGKMCVVVGDVSGHGLASALIMVETRSILHACLEDHEDLSLVAERLNRYLFRDTPEQQFVTFFMAEINHETQTLSYFSAGHPSWLIDGHGQRRSLATTTPPLGLIETLPCSTTHLPFLPGDMLFVATDGIPEAYSASGQMFGWERTVQQILDHRDKSPEEILEKLIQRVEEFQSGNVRRAEADQSPSRKPIHFEDDLTAVLVKHQYAPASVEPSCRKRFPLSGWLV